GDLVLLLYDGAMRYLGLAELAINERRLEAANTNLIQAQEVVLELYAGLNYELGDELARNLSRLYVYIHGELVAANMAKDVDKIRRVAALLRQLRDAWRTALSAPAHDRSDRPVAVGRVA